jgi:hypothetical protein
MYLLPQSFVFAKNLLLLPGFFAGNSGSPPPMPLFGQFEKACRTSSRGRLFHF